MIGGQTSSIDGELYKIKIINMIARYPTRLLEFINTINFLGAET